MSPAPHPFKPDPLPFRGLDHGRLIGLVGKANRALARYDGLLQGIVNPAVLLSPLTTQEAVLSSKIEGTQATLDEVLEHEAGRTYDPEKTRDIQEIVNYRVALVHATEALAHRPLSLGMVKDIHGILMESVRGSRKSPGSFRTEQNWIGPPGTPIEHASYVPPAPIHVTSHLENWEAYLEFEEVDPLVHIAIVHAQFELIHPFEDGNGRIGRLLIPLFLFQKRVLAQPMFYLSAYLEAHRDVYYRCLQGISRKGDWNGWIAFFLEAVVHQAAVNADKVQAIHRLYEEMKVRITENTHSQFAIQALDAIFDRPIFGTSEFVRRSGIGKQTAMLILRRLRRAEILMPLREGSGRRPAILAFPQLVNLAEGKKVV
jgi:cell filamentation protein, protein adenylyltransferase